MRFLRRLPVGRSRTSEVRGRTQHLHIDTCYVKRCAFHGTRRCCIRFEIVFGFVEIRKFGAVPFQSVSSVQFSSVQFSSVQFSYAMEPGGQGWAMGGGNTDAERDGRVARSVGVPGGTPGERIYPSWAKYELSS